MAQRIFGYYPSEKKAIEIVNGLALKGYRAKDITMFTNYSSRKALQKYTDVNVQSSIHEFEAESSFLDHIQRIFVRRTEQHVDFYDKLISFGISEEQVEECLVKIESGKVLIIVDDMIKLGHAPLNEVVRPNLLYEKDNEIDEHNL